MARSFAEQSGDALAMMDAGANTRPAFDGPSHARNGWRNADTAARQRLPGLPAILPTGSADSQVEMKLAKEGLTAANFGLMRKPASADQLADPIMALMERRSSRRV